MKLKWLIGFSLIVVAAACHAVDLATQHSLTPQKILQNLKAGNARFIANKMLHRDSQQEILDTKTQQYPVAVVLSCMDSRNIPSLSFDQGIGDIFSIRIAGNVLNDDILGSMEYGTKVVGAKLIVVMGHTHCGAVSSACKGVELGHITALINKIKPAVQKLKDTNTQALCKDDLFVDKIAKQNVMDVIKEIAARSPIIAKLLEDKKVEIVGAMYDVGTGKVDFFNDI